jgi:hypothetical protein
MIIKSVNEELSRYKEIIADPFFLKDRTLLELFKRSLPPREAYYYFPKGEEIVIFNHKRPEKSLRRIHINVPYTNLENEWLSKFKLIIASHPENKLPYFWNDGLNLAYIYSTECKLDKAYIRMIEYFRWYEEHFPMYIQPEDKIIKFLNTGCTYVFGRDHQFRPIIIVQPYLLEKVKKEYSDSDVLSGCIFLTQYMTNYMLIPGQIENIIMFINLEQISLLSIPDSLKKIIKTMSEYYIATLYKSYIIGLNSFLKFLFKIFCNFLEEITVRKFVVLEDKDDPKLFQDINPQNIEERFGGSAPNCVYDQENCLFPPRMPSNYYLKEDEDPNEIFISEEEYIQRYNEGKIPKGSVSPFIIDKIKRERKEKEKEEMMRKKREQALIIRNEAKSKAELNLNTNWKSENEYFDLKKFNVRSNGFLNELKNFRNMKAKFCNNLVLLKNKSN